MNHHETSDNAYSFDNDMPTITTNMPHGLPVGSRITMEVPDRRWWRRLLFRLLRRDPPMRKKTLRVTAVSETTITAQAKGGEHA